MVGRKKKAQTEILSIVLILLIILVAIAIIWNVVFPLIKEKSKDIQFGEFVVSFDIQDIILFENGVLKINIYRGAGNEELEGLRFVFIDENKNQVIRDKETLKELETKTYHFSPLDDLQGKVQKVDVAPIIDGKIGMPTESNVGEVLEVPSSVISWWKFDDLNDLVGENTCSLIGESGINGGYLSGGADCGNKDLGLNNEMTISFWIYGLEDRILIDKSESYKITLENKKVRFTYLDSGNSGISDDEIIEGWNYVVVSISPATPKIHINSGIPKLIYTESSGASLVSSLENIKFYGEIDEVMIFNKSLSIGTIGVLYKHQLR